MKKNFTIIMIMLPVSIFSQTLKTFNGTFNDGKLQNGNAVYTYYEDPSTHKYLKQGLFKYTFNGSGDYKGFNQVITGNFEKGLKIGTWTYSTTMTDFGYKNVYNTGTVTLVANYKEGYADGNWKLIKSLKNRKKNWDRWEAFSPLNTMTINMNFKKGYLVGSVNINDEFAKFKANGNFDDKSLCIGTWNIDDAGFGDSRELIYKDNMLYEAIWRDKTGELKDTPAKYQKEYDELQKAIAIPPNERDNFGITIDTICGSDLCAAMNNIRDYFSYFFTTEYFLYKYIGGDLSYEEGFKGGCQIQVKGNVKKESNSIKEPAKINE